MYYSITHTTSFSYSAPISESVMELRMQPRSEGLQQCLRFLLRTQPRTNLRAHRDYLGNTIHHFDIPGHHTLLTITAEALVSVGALPLLPEALAPAAWHELDHLVQRDDYWDMLMPSQFAEPTAALRELARELGLERRDDPLTMLRALNTAVHDAFQYTPQSTRVDSPIDDALRTRKGVCQDFAHIMTALVRELGIPCRYVSGYLFHRVEDQDRSAEDATHAWVEALLPGLGWVGFDPTNNLLASARHIRVAVGRDYADVPPTRGVFKGGAESTLGVSVRVLPSDAPPEEEELEPIGWTPESAEQAQMQMQQ
ncbi:MAG TPA: transglutaminase family protein [Roseiflexaceae bacterium]|nr:transglutaminase family protein [Roseiflexaceae bacterium]